MEGYEQNLKSESMSGIVPGFLSKTYEIFNTPTYSDCCGWGKGGETIIITKIDDFAKHVLPQYFKHSNFQSFVRQLNMYDFRKTTQDPNIGEFYHPFFKENRPELLISIKRKANHRIRKESSETPDGNVGDDDMTVKPEALISESESLLKVVLEQKIIQQEFEKKFQILEKQQSDLLEQNLNLHQKITEYQSKQILMENRLTNTLYLIRNFYTYGSAAHQPMPNPAISNPIFANNLSLPAIQDHNTFSSSSDYKPVYNRDVQLLSNGSFMPDSSFMNIPNNYSRQVSFDTYVNNTNACINNQSISNIHDLSHPSSSSSNSTLNFTITDSSSAIIPSFNPTANTIVGDGSSSNSRKYQPSSMPPALAAVSAAAAVGMGEASDASYFSSSSLASTASNNNYSHGFGGKSMRRMQSIRASDTTNIGEGAGGGMGMGMGLGLNVGDKAGMGIGLRRTLSRGPIEAVEYKSERVTELPSIDIDIDSPSHKKQRGQDTRDTAGLETADDGIVGIEFLDLLFKNQETALSRLDSLDMSLEKLLEDAKRVI